MEKWYRPGRLVGEYGEEPDAVLMRRGPSCAGPYCGRHSVVPGLDPRYQFCKYRCGYVLIVAQALDNR